MNPDNFKLEVQSREVVPEHKFHDGYIVRPHSYGGITFSNYKNEMKQQLYQKYGVGITQEYYQDHEKIMGSYNYIDDYFLDAWKKQKPVNQIYMEIFKGKMF